MAHSLTERFALALGLVKISTSSHEALVQLVQTRHYGWRVGSAGVYACQKSSQIYKWQEAVLSLAIDLHTLIVCNAPTDIAKWAIPHEFKSRFCLSSLTILGTSCSSGITSPKHKRCSL